MGRKRSRRSSSKARPQPAPGTRVTSFRLHAELTALELTSGHDGLLRGMPEPVVVLGGFLIEGSAQARPLGRVLVRLAQPEGRFPTVIKPAAPTPLKARGRSTENARVVLIAIAVEEDDGKDLERVYGLLSDGRKLRAWDVDAALPSPATLAEIGAGPLSPPPLGQRVHLLDDAVDLRDMCTVDDFVGVSLLVLPVTQREEGFRMHFVSADQKNDWTAIVGVSIG